MTQKAPRSTNLPKFDPGSKQPFQERAVRAFPKLVSLAKAEHTITYSEFARALGMQNPKNLNYVLGAVAGALKELSKAWKRSVPPLTLLVVNKKTGIPGEGVAGIVPDPAAFRNGTLASRKRVVDMFLHEVFDFKDWDKVLTHFGLQPEKIPLPPPPPLPSVPDSLGQGAGESEDHKRLKEFVARNPEAIGLKGFPKGAVEIEHTFPSADAIDILFKTEKRWIGVEVKGVKSCEFDVRRGLYQCVKYIALMEASMKAEQKRLTIEVILVLGGNLPESLRAEKDILDVKCHPSVSVPPEFEV